jgi:hypothetical protein
MSQDGSISDRMNIFLSIYSGGTLMPNMGHCGFTQLLAPGAVDKITEYHNKFFVCCKHKFSIV